jgi:hypothetical protein
MMRTGTLASAKTVYAVERLAKADRRLAATVDQWDSDQLLLNTPGGVIDLRDGTLRAPSPDDYMTKIAAVAPGGECPIWEGFLDRITNGDHELTRFLQRVIGYSLAGLTSEHALFFCYGTGANGKSVLINTVAEICADYHKTAPIETFTVSPTERHPIDLAGLRGARIVASVETEEGRRWAEAKIKNLTAGDRISARFMRQDFFEFTPQFKLICQLRNRSLRRPRHAGREHPGGVRKFCDQRFSGFLRLKPMPGKTRNFKGVGGAAGASCRTRRHRRSACAGDAARLCERLGRVHGMLCRATRDNIAGGGAAVPCVMRKGKRTQRKALARRQPDGRGANTLTAVDHVLELPATDAEIRPMNPR